jgi:hypothetical protein
MNISVGMYTFRLEHLRRAGIECVVGIAIMLTLTGAASAAYGVALATDGTVAGILKVVPIILLSLMLSRIVSAKL